MTRQRSVGIVILLGLASLAIITTNHVRRSSDRPVPAYTVAQVSRGDITRAVMATGQLRPWTSVEVSSQISGLVSEIYVDVDAAVRQGQVLARIDPSTYEQRLHQAQADLAAARANHALMQANASRLRDLHGQDLVTQQEYDQSAAQLQQSEAALLTRTAAVNNAQLDLDRCTITSPINGIVLFKEVEVGKMVVSSFSAPTLFVIVQLQKMRIVAPINEVDVFQLHADQVVTFAVDAFPTRHFEGRLTHIRNPYIPSEKQLQQQAQPSSIPNFEAMIEVDNQDLFLRPNLTATISIIVDKRKDVLLIPTGALRVEGLGDPSDVPQKVPIGSARNDQVATVYRLLSTDRTSTPEPVSVRLGLSNGVLTEVMSGLRNGDRVITGVVVSPDVDGPNQFL